MSLCDPPCPAEPAPAWFFQWWAQEDPRAAGPPNLARRILASLLSVYGPNSSPRVILPEGAGWSVFGPGPAGAGTVTRRASWASSPVVHQWLAGESALDPLPLLRVLGEGPAPLHKRPLGPSGREGAITVRAVVWDRVAERRFDEIASIATAWARSERIQQQLRREAETDGLTGVLNYRAFLRALAGEMESHAIEGRDLTLLMLDVDNLKYYNDRFGHLGGSAALREIAALLVRHCRSIDGVAKYGGDEFSVLLPLTSAEGGRAVAERLRSVIAAHAFEGDPARRLTVSIGMAVHPFEGSDPHDLLRRADERLYDAKCAGRNRIGVPECASWSGGQREVGSSPNR